VARGRGVAIVGAEDEQTRQHDRGHRVGRVAPRGTVARLEAGEAPCLVRQPVRPVIRR
jgi:hypothetical protein